MRSRLPALQIRPRQTTDLGGDRARSYEAMLAIVTLVACLGAWSANDGGYEETWWYPVALVVLLLGFVLTWAMPGRRSSGWANAAVATFGAYTAWSFFSILWASDRGLALTGANRTLLYLIIFGVVTRVRWRTGEGTAVLVLWAFATVTAGAVQLSAAALSGNIRPQFFDGRLATPIGYANANAALFVLAAWPFVALFIDRTRSAWMRAAACGFAALAAGMALLAQSKGAAIGTAAAVLLCAVVSRRRAMFLFAVVLVAAVLGALYHPLFAVYDHLQAGDTTRHPVVLALAALAGAFVAATVLGAAFVLISSRARFSGRRGLSLIAPMFTAAIAAASIIAVVAAVDHYGGPSATARHAWRSFVHPQGNDDHASHFLSTAGNHRYDFWRVALRQFEDSPLLGAGADNFAADYIRERRSNEEPLYPHSLEARLLGGTGAVGFLLFVAFLVAVCVPLLRAVRSDSTRAPLALGAIGMLAYWVAHGSVDWLWEFPGLTGPVLLAVGATLGVEQLPEASQRAVRRNLQILVYAVAVVAAVILLLPSWLAARDVAIGADIWRTDPTRATRLLRSAARLEPLSDQAYQVLGTIAERRRDWPLAEQWFRHAATRNDANWYSHLELAIALSKQGKLTAATVEIRRARLLDPREPIIADVANAIRTHGPINVGRLDRNIVARTTVHSAA